MKAKKNTIISSVCVRCSVDLVSPRLAKCLAQQLYPYTNAYAYLAGYWILDGRMPGLLPILYAYAYDEDDGAKAQYMTGLWDCDYDADADGRRL